MRRIRNFFVTGLIVLIPVMATIFFLSILFHSIDGILEPVIRGVSGYYVPGLGAISTLIIIFITGIVATNYLGARMLHGVEYILTRMPLVRGIYGTSKQLVDAVFHPESTPFKRVCIIEYPRHGVYSIGFVTGEMRKDPDDPDSEEMVNIFIAATPNPTFGFYIVVPKSEVTYLDMGIDEGLKLVVSGGIILPPGKSLFKAKSPDNHQEQG